MEIPLRFFLFKSQPPEDEEPPEPEKDNGFEVEEESEEELVEEEVVIPETPVNRPLVYFIAGGFGGACSVVIGHPFDTIKVKIQTMPKPKKGRKPLYTGTVDCAIKVMKKHGIAGFYKGMGLPLTSIAPVFALCFFGFGLGKSIQEAAGENPERLSPIQTFLAGSFSGLLTTVIITPCERIKLLLQIQEEPGYIGKFSGPSDAVVKLYKRGGIKNLYKGMIATLVRDVPSTGVYFMTYEWLTKFLGVEDDDHPVKISKIILAGGLAGMANWGLGMPADMIKSKLQSAPDGLYPNGIRDVFKELYVEEGLGSLFKGMLPVMLRAFPSNAACFAGFELSRNMLNSVLNKSNDI